MRTIEDFLKRRYWGWGNQASPVPTPMVDAFTTFLEQYSGICASPPLELPDTQAIELPEPRFVLPAAFAEWLTSDKEIRLHHCFGKSFRDSWRATHLQFDNPPDYVAFPGTDGQLAELFRFAKQEGIHVIPYGGGSSVVGGIEPPPRDQSNGVISVNMLNFNQVLEVDEVSRCARIQAGTYGPDLERQLKPFGLTLRHFPQSFEFSTLGGWIATRAGGHYATQYTHIDEFVESIRLVTPEGTMQTRRLPGSGAGPSEERLILGSEGTLGIITEAWVRLQAIPQYKAATTIGFTDYSQGVEACRQISQSGLQPSNARYIGRQEAMFMGLGDGSKDILILGFESNAFPVTDRLKQAISLALECGGTDLSPQTGNPDAKQRDTGADNWKQAFITVPYLRDELVRRGLIVETLETAITWDRFDRFHQRLLTTANAAIRDQCGKGFITCRFTHLYPDGPAPYYTIMAQGNGKDDLKRWDAIKRAVSDALIEEGGTITHHHAVGRDHKMHYLRQASPLFVSMLRSAKGSVDPDHLLNPGILFD
ncbi:FAD-binding oxidoreductase [Marinobacter sp. M216]|uniref:FAD-binding oxidoreductase n=1 Tax=Marinobacter albus TaxID=3030833 RepID=A0ABT7HE79_9GAMM|nr:MULTISPECIES: FAD-binding oxidoreductase [unclassified Marinobacter]MBW7469561.1 FAD-binding oxidoreductase [Marinobacter sp. F4218]MDK9558170.1 FAD-binding oxidoreductase [Marinobacter sp. M216]